MARTLVLECDSGISGDMVVGALLDLGASEEGLRTALAGLSVSGYEVRVSRKLAGALEACDFDVVMDAMHENHDHDMAWLFGTTEDDHGHDRHHHDRHHDHPHEHDHEHCTLADIAAILAHADLSDRVRQTALRIFTVIAEAEARAHGATVDTVHFHEVGAVDSLVDVVAAAWCLDNLGIQDVVVSPLAEGEGHIRSAHGVLSIPVPAVTHIVAAHGLVLKRAHRKGELVTPTGAAIAAAIRTRAELPEQYRIVATGLGCGKRAYDPPSTLRALLIEEIANTPATAFPVWKLETEVDDCTGEALGYVLDLLYQAGAREAHYLPVFMKKGRPGYQVEVLCNERDIAALEQVLFENTTTIGIRRCPMDRTALVRSVEELQTSLGPALVKRVTLPSGVERVYPEHDSVAQLACDHGISYQDAFRAVLVASSH